MKKKGLVRHTKRLTAVALVLLLVFSICGCSVSDDLSQNQTGGDVPPIFVYTSLGDSMAGDFSLTENGTTGNSFSCQFSDYLENYCKSEDSNEDSNIVYTYHDLSIDNATTDDVLKQLNDADVVGKLRDSDVITISVGFNDILNAVQKAVGDAMMGAKLDKNFGKYLTEKDVNNETLADFSNELSNGNYTKWLTNAENQYESKISEIVQKIYQINPDTLVIVNSFYNPYADVKVVNEVPGNEKTIFNVGPMTGRFLGNMNSYLEKQLKVECDADERSFEIADISGLPVAETNVVFNGDIYSSSNSYDTTLKIVGHNRIFSALKTKYQEYINASN